MRGVVVIGGGHAGIEASWVAARQKMDTVLITLRADRVGAMSCNPAIGGQGKGQLVKELDVLGGVMPRVADETGIQFRRLNTKKGPAVWSSRAQSDKERYARTMLKELRGRPSLEIIEGEVCEVCPQGWGYQVVLADGRRLESRAVILTVGTFLNGVMHVGPIKSEGGRYGDDAAKHLSRSMERWFGVQWRRFKTGTPPRLESSSIAWDRLQVQEGDPTPSPFSLWSTGARNQVVCHLTHTTPEAHHLIADNIDQAPLFNGQITSLGPRYCPSIEDKVMRFKDRPRHQLFLEPESLETPLIYVNGLSTSLPAEIQERVVHIIPGLERARFLRHGYAVEYDCIDPRILDTGLQHRGHPGLFFAGQINGTSGYEEAAAQGFVAGLSASCYVRGDSAPIFDRTYSYIGVMVDDLIHTGSEEPYRMFTARCEFRLSGREDNAVERLLPMAKRYHLLSQEQGAFCETLLDAKQDIRSRAGKIRVATSQGEMFLDQAIRRGEFEMPEMFHMEHHPEVKEQVSRVKHRGYLLENLFVELKYEGYLEKERRSIAWVQRENRRTLPPDMNYEGIPGLSNEAKTKLQKSNPTTLGEVRALYGVTPADVLALLRHLEKSRESPTRQDTAVI